MVDQIIRPSALPRRTNPVASEIAPVDNGTSVAGSTLAEIVNAGRPLASRAEAEAGTNAEKAMTPLTVDQKIEYEIGRSLASKAQGDKADSAIQEIVGGANTTVDNTDPQRPIISSSGNPSVGFKSDIVVVDGQTDWRIARNYKTVPDLLADDGSGDMGMGYVGSGANVIVSPGDIVTAKGFRYEVAASGATDAHVETAGGVKLYYVDPVWRPAAWGIVSGPQDQKTILQKFVNAAAARRALVEWGDLDVSINATDDGLTPGQRGLMVPSNSQWVMSPNTVIRALPTARDIYAVLNIRNTSNIIIEGNRARLIGDRNSHIGTGGEAGFGIEFRGCSDVVVSDIRSENMWGDGFYMDATAQQLFVRNINLIRPVAYNCRRQGLSVISAVDLWVIDAVWDTINGTAPTAGVDIEPGAGHYLKNINFIRPVSKNCEGPGFYIFLSSMTTSPELVSIFIEEPKDYGSRNNIWLICDKPLNGVVEIKSPYGERARLAGIAIREWNYLGPRLVIDKPHITGANQTASTLDRFACGITITSTDETSGNVISGNIEINEPWIRGANQRRAIGIFDDRAVRLGTSGIKIADIVSANGVDGILRTSGLDAEFKLTDKYGVLKSSLPNANTEISATNFSTEMSNAAYTAERTVTLSQNLPVGTVLKFNIDQGQYLRIVATGATIRPIVVTAGNWVRSNELGASLKIEKVTNTYWRVVDMVGVWSAQV